MVSLRHGTYVMKWMPPTPEMPRWYWACIHFPPEFLASISHMNAEEQQAAKEKFADQIIAAQERAKAAMTPEQREAQSQEWIEANKAAEKVLASEAAKKHAKR